MTVRSESVNTQACLRGFPGTANYTDPKQRLLERDRIKEYWPEDLIRQIEMGTINAPPWRMLLDPTRWGDVDPQKVHSHVRTYLSLYGKWPSLDALRRRFGRVSNHRTPAEVPGQKSLL